MFGPVSTIITGATPGERGLAFARARPGGIVVYQETPLGPVRAIKSTPNSPFNELQGVLYATSTATPDQILVTQGSLHGWDLLLRTLTRPGDRVLLESPGYPAIADAAAAQGPRHPA